MTATDLLFQAPQPATLDLRFGNVFGGKVDYIDLTITGALPAPVFLTKVELGIDNAVNRAPGLRTGSAWQDGKAVSALNEVAFDRYPTQQANYTQEIAQADKRSSGNVAAWNHMASRVTAERAAWAGGKVLQNRLSAHFEDMNHTRRYALSAAFAEGKHRTSQQAPKWKVLSTKQRPSKSFSSCDGKRYARLETFDFAKAGSANRSATGMWANAIRPPAGISAHVIGPTTPPKEPCYKPASGLSVALVFSDTLDLSTDLIFRCANKPTTPVGQTIIVPVKRAYIVMNSVNLRRVSDNAEIPCYSFNMSLDTDSWTWAFNASLHHSGLQLVEPTTYGTPVELDVEVNGAHYRVLVESISRDRQFGNTRIAIGGRGKSAVLADPYSPILTFSNSQIRTAQQLINDALMDNGVSIGWAVDFGLEDWSVPAGVFSHSGSYMSAVKTIAESAGGYIQPDPVLNKLYVKARYPAAPWNWGNLTPDFSLPADITSRENIAWVDKANYNGVYVSGQSVGVNALVRKGGTAGDYLAPMVVDPLITDNIAARQRGIAVLGQTGRLANVTLSLPVLPETGIIVPGKIVDYVDGGTTRRGITRAVSVNVNMPSIRQSIEVETHVY